MEGVIELTNNRLFRRKKCTTFPCARCSEKRGGYKLKWVANEWMAAYVKLMEEGWGQRADQPQWHLMGTGAIDGFSRRTWEHAKPR